MKLCLWVEGLGEIWESIFVSHPCQRGQRMPSFLPVSGKRSQISRVWSLYFNSFFTFLPPVLGLFLGVWDYWLSPKIIVVLCDSRIVIVLFDCLFWYWGLNAGYWILQANVIPLSHITAKNINCALGCSMKDKICSLLWRLCVPDT